MARGVPINVTDDGLRQAVSRSDSWRGVLRHLGYATTNGRTSALLRQRARQLECDTSHFRQRATTWTDEQLKDALVRGGSWGDVLSDLGLATSGSATVAVKARAGQLGLDYSHIERRHRAPRGEVPPTGEARDELLRSAAPNMAAAWFIQRGHHVSWPLEPCPYDLVVDISRVLYRVQVKTATAREGTTGSWICRLAQNGNGKGTPYDPDDIDYFFIVDAEGSYYLIPIEEVAGQGALRLGAMEHRKIRNGS